MSSKPNADAVKFTIRCLVNQLLTESPPPSTSSTSGKARTWLSTSGNVKPAAVNSWLRRNLTSDSLITSGDCPLTPINAAAYTSEIEAVINAFIAGPRPNDPSGGPAWDWFVDPNPSSEIPSEAIDWLSDNLPVAS